MESFDATAAQREERGLSKVSGIILQALDSFTVIVTRENVRVGFLPTESTPCPCPIRSKFGVLFSALEGPSQTYKLLQSQNIHQFAPNTIYFIRILTTHLN